MPSRKALPKALRAAVRPCPVTGLPIPAPPERGRWPEYHDAEAKRISDLVSALERALDSETLRMAPAAAKALRSRLWFMANLTNDKKAAPEVVAAMFEAEEASRAALLV